MVGIDAALLHHFGAGRTQAELMQPDHFSAETDGLNTNLGNARFDGHAALT